VTEAGLLSRPRAILFDWDNTLVDNWPAIHEALNATFAAMGHDPWTLAETKARVRRSLRDSFPEMFGARWTEARKIFYDTFAAVHIDRLAPVAGVEETLNWLAGKDIYLAVVSNKSGKYLRAEARALGWERFFGRLVGATDAEADKPAAAPVRLALEGTGIAPSRDVWFVGDGAIDVQCALAAGLRPLLLEGPEIRDELTRHNLDPFVVEIMLIAGVSGLQPLVDNAVPLSSR